MFVVVGGGNPRDQFALLAITRNDRDRTRAEFLERILFSIEPQAGLQLLTIGTVTSIAILGQDRPDVPIEVDLGRSFFRLRLGTEQAIQRKATRQAELFRCRLLLIK